jgi:hypothetical protein
MKTDAFIDLLAADPPPRWRFQSQFGLMTTCGVAAAAVTFFLVVGPRHDLSQVMESLRFLFKFVVTLALAVTATGATLRIGDPARTMHRWAWALACAPTLLAGAAVIVEMVTTPNGDWFPRLVGHNAWRCVTLIPFLSIGPLVCLLLALRHGAPARPGLAGAMAGLAASGIAATFYAANCTDDSPLFVATWFSLAALIVTITGYLAGTKLLNW